MLKNAQIIQKLKVKKMSRKGLLVVISGFSGAGKGTLMKKLTTEYDNYALSISATTRAPRVGEVDGREYFFKTKEEFEKMIECNELIEYAKYVDNYYGTPKDYVLSNLEAGKDVLLEIEIQGALLVKEQFPEAKLVFITPPSAFELKSRLINRNTEDMDTIMKRLNRASEEALGVENYDYIIVNDDLTKCVDDFHNLIANIHDNNIEMCNNCCVSNNINIINEIRESLCDLGKGE